MTQQIPEPDDGVDASAVIGILQTKLGANEVRIAVLEATVQQKNKKIAELTASNARMHERITELSEVRET